MAISIQETFRVEAPAEAVWRFMLDPHRVATCMPGADLEDVVDERNFLGRIKVKVGAITTSYSGRVQFVEVDEGQRVVRMVAEGRESGGGTASGTMSSRVLALADGQAEVVAEANVELTGRIMQVGRGMIEGVSRELFQQFASCAKQRLESPDEPFEAEGGKEPIRILPLIIGVAWSSIVRFFGRIFRRQKE